MCLKNEGMDVKLLFAWLTHNWVLVGGNITFQSALSVHLVTLQHQIAKKNVVNI